MTDTQTFAAGTVLHGMRPGRKQPRQYRVESVAKGTATLRLVWETPAESATVAEDGRVTFPFTGKAFTLKVTTLKSAGFVEYLRPVE